MAQRKSNWDRFVDIGSKLNKLIGLESEKRDRESAEIMRLTEREPIGPPKYAEMVMLMNGNCSVKYPFSGRA